MISFMGGSHVGVLGLLIAKAFDDVLCCVSYDKEVKYMADKLKIHTYASIKEKEFINQLMGADLLLCVHGREIVPKKIIKLRPCINVHPYLYKYKGCSPIERALKDRNFKASVGSHYMTKEVDMGETIIEEFADVSGNSVKEIYNELYPLYCRVIIKTLEAIK